MCHWQACRLPQHRWLFVVLCSDRSQEVKSSGRCVKSASKCVPDSPESLSLCRPAATREKHLPRLTCAACVRGDGALLYLHKQTAPRLYPGRACAHKNSPLHFIGRGVNKNSGATDLFYPRRHLRVSGCLPTLYIPPAHRSALRMRPASFLSSIAKGSRGMKMLNVSALWHRVTG